VEFSFFFLVAIAGYFSTFNETGTIVLERQPANGQSKDYAILIAIISIILV
jgi:hypothetical protein